MVCRFLPHSTQLLRLRLFFTTAIKVPLTPYSAANNVGPSPVATSDASSFRGVYVNVPSGAAGHRKSPASMSTNPSTLSSPDSVSMVDGYETPETSASVTPTVSVAPTSKRKRSAPSSLKVEWYQENEGDAEIAQALQEEEYNIDDARKGKKTGPSRILDEKILISDSDDDAAHHDDLSELSDPIEISSDDEPISKKRKKNGKAPATPATNKGKGKGVQTASSTKRSVRTSANKARQNLKLKDGFVDDSDDESDFISDDGSELKYFDSESEDDLSEAESLDSSGSDAPAAPPVTAAQPRTQRRRGNQRPAISRRRRLRMSRADWERLRLEEAHPEIKTMWDDLAAVPLIPTEAAEQPQSITRSLKSFQLEGLNWMRKQEQTKWGGGLLGDEMGMGKTIQAVSLIMSDYPQKDPTLVVVPPVALMQWSTEISEYTDGKLKVLVYHGSNTKAKKMSVKELKSYDVIMISYSSLESIYRKETKGWSRDDKIVKEDSAIHSITFHRLLLDEAHSIKSRTTGVAKACFALKGKYKWCLSGTPVQNRIGEFFSLLRFLGCTPCRGLDHVSVFNQEILNPITTAEDDTSRKTAFGKLRLLTDRIMLRRMKRDHTASMELPPKEVIIHNEFFGEIEKDFANSIMGQSARKFDTYVARGVMLDNYANIFGLIMQMRQVSDHPDLITKKKAEGGQNVLVCNICDEPAEDAIRSQCKHEFCRACAKDFVKTCENSDATPDCPRCHIPLSVDFDQPEIEQDAENVKSNSIINRIKMENWTSSTKIEMLVYDLWKLRSPKQTTKSIVFSQFTSMLQLVEWRLRRAGFNTVMLDGSMSPQQRQKSIEHFMNNTDVEVFLVSLKAGGVALNLTEASRIFIIDPWWNPAAEWQSADRCHRIGQKRPCVITRLVVEDSIESRIVLLQEKKAHMINSTVNKDDVSMEKLTPQDMQFLFRGS
ncbi:MAG: hypothetical protein Q9162_003955 [Coniocarpon cinnabarinum]